MASRPCFFFPHRAVYKAGLKEPTAFAAKNTMRLVGIVGFEGGLYVMVICSLHKMRYVFKMFASVNRLRKAAT